MLANLGQLLKFENQMITKVKDQTNTFLKLEFVLQRMSSTSDARRFASNKQC